MIFKQCVLSLKSTFIYIKYCNRGSQIFNWQKSFFFQAEVLDLNLLLKRTVPLKRKIRRNFVKYFKYFYTEFNRKM